MKHSVEGLAGGMPGVQVGSISLTRDGLVRSPEALLSLYGPVPKRAAGKVHPTLDRHDRRFIDQSPFLVLATAARDGLLDVSPRGDLPGFVHVLDERHMVLPDRPGNNRIDSLLNVLSDPRVAMIFLIPGVGQTLRVNGSAEVRTDAAALSLGEVGGRRPATALLVEVQEVLYQCPRALARSQLWDLKSQLRAQDLPNLDEVLADQVPGLSPEESRAIGRASTDDPLW